MSYHVFLYRYKYRHAHITFISDFSTEREDGRRRRGSYVGVHADMGGCRRLHCDSSHFSGCRAVSPLCWQGALSSRSFSSNRYICASTIWSFIRELGMSLLGFLLWLMKRCGLPLSDLVNAVSQEEEPETALRRITENQRRLSSTTQRFLFSFPIFYGSFHASL